MKRWTRAKGDTWCGRCSAVVASGEPLLVLELPNVARRPVRCASCAGEPVNVEQLEAEDVRADRARFTVQSSVSANNGWGSVADAARDWRRQRARAKPFDPKKAAAHDED